MRRDNPYGFQTEHYPDATRFAIQEVLVVLVVLEVIFIFFSLFLQLVLLQRIVDIYVCIIKMEFFVPIQSGASTWRFDVLENHFLI